MNQHAGSPAAAGTPTAQPPVDEERLRQDLHATLGARQELGPRYEAELIESFLKRLDQSIDARIEQRLTGKPAQPDGPRTPAEPKHGYNPTNSLAASLGISIPLIAIAGGIAGLPGILGVLVLVGFLNVYYDQQHH